MIICPVMKTYLEIRAGEKALALVQEEGLRPERIAAFAGPAGGPKWFVSVGFDRALIRSEFLRTAGRRILLAGASAGAWRCLAMACKDPLEAYEKLRIAYSRNVFTASDTPATVSKALDGNVRSFLGLNDEGFILNHPCFDLAVHTVRAQSIAASDSKILQGMGLLLSAMLNLFSSKAMGIFYERVVFFSGPVKPIFLNHSFQGRSAPLTEDNLQSVALATGSLPFIVSGVTDIPHAPEGVYRDGGLRDYQLNECYSRKEDGLTLFFHYQERIVPGWFDKKLGWRRPSRETLSNVVQIYPGQAFLDLLPDKRLPDRNDFVEFVHNPNERIRRWDTVSELSEILGQEFMECVESGSIKKRVKPM
ncbi:MAG: hypothetical protein QG577_1082 [Thermodesulfobacteriota bacterium]|nr:hypothetical protein [Thermodesulfobacteriota bacterium]